MNLARRLASAQRRKDQHPNIDLAIELVDGWDEDAVTELFALLDAGPKKQRHDALKVLYEIGIRAPELLLPHFDELIDALDTRDNRILWGCIYALRSLVDQAREQLMACLPLILDAAERSTIIARDKAMYILVALASDERYHDAVTPLMLRHIETAATNQFPTYAERAEPTLRPEEAPLLIAIIEAHDGLEAHPAKRRRMDKLLRRLAAQ